MNAITETPNGALMGFIERAARDPEFDVAKFALLLDKQQEMLRERARQEFNAGMADCQSQMEPVLRTATNPGVKSKYAKLEDIDREIRPIYTASGFSVRFGSDVPPQPGWMRITCTVAHRGGYSEQNYLDSPVSTQGSQGGRIAMTPVQAVGSVVTYLRRYLLGMVFNIVQADVVGIDDDGEGQRNHTTGLETQQEWEKRKTAEWRAKQAAALDMKRADKVVDKSEVYETPPQDAPRTRTRRDFLDGLAIALRDATSAEEVDRIVCGEEVMRAKEAFQNGHKAELDKLIAAALKKWWHEAPEPDLSDEAMGDEALGEIEIKGMEKVGSGD